jgi:hypothetical protein
MTYLNATEQLYTKGSILLLCLSSVAVRATSSNHAAAPGDVQSDQDQILPLALFTDLISDRARNIQEFASRYHGQMGVEVTLPYRPFRWCHRTSPPEYNDRQ